MNVCIPFAPPHCSIFFPSSSAYLLSKVNSRQRKIYLSVRLLEASSCTSSSELLRLASSWVSNQEGSIVLKKKVLDFLLGGLVDVLLVVSDNSSGDGLSDGVHLGDSTTTLHSDADVNTGKSF